MNLKFFNLKVYSDNNFEWNNSTLITVGTFDGVHLGHKFVIETCKSLANENNLNFLVYTFYPHPREVLGNKDFKILTTQKEKLYLLEKYGVENVFIKNFNIEFSKKSAKDFIVEELIKKFNLKVLVLGYDNQFGKNREGSYEQFIDLAKIHNFKLYKLEPLYINNIPVSSTKIRNAINEGNIELANEMLGYTYFIEGNVVSGLKIGRQLGFPTANVDVEDFAKLIPPTGVYVVAVAINEKVYKGVLNIGYRPTLNIPNLPLSIEVHIIDFDEDIYNKIIRIYFFKKIREDIKFPSLQELKYQIQKDIDFTLCFFSQKPNLIETKINL